MKQSINCSGNLVDIQPAHVMGIINVTPDSFHDGGKYNQQDQLLNRVEQHLEEGATFIDVGAVSTRPGADEVSLEEEVKRLIPSIEAIHKRWPDAILSADTFRAEVARRAIGAGASIINDVAAGGADQEMFKTIGELQVPYIIMHMQGKPKTMQKDPQYTDVLDEVLAFFTKKVTDLRKAGIHDVIIDPGFGFGKTVQHNYSLLRNLNRFLLLETPILAGISRKSMINKVLSISSEGALNGTTALHMIALEGGARILRAHDVKEAMECVKLWRTLNDVAP